MTDEADTRRVEPPTYNGYVRKDAYDAEVRLRQEAERERAEAWNAAHEQLSEVRRLREALRMLMAPGVPYCPTCADPWHDGANHDDGPPGAALLDILDVLKEVATEAAAALDREGEA